MRFILGNVLQETGNVNIVSEIYVLILRTVIGVLMEFKAFIKLLYSLKY